MFLSGSFVLSSWAITPSGAGIALAYINLFAFDISNNYDSALLKLEVLLTANCLQAIFVWFYLFKRWCHWRNRGNVPFWEWCCVRMVLLGWSHWEQQCTVSHPKSPQTCVRAFSAFPKSHIPEIIAGLPAFPKLGQVEVLFQTSLLFRDLTFGVSRNGRCHHPLGVSLSAFTKKQWNIQEDSSHESPFSNNSGLFLCCWSSAVNEIRTANVSLGTDHAERVLCCCFDWDLMWLRLYRIFFRIVFVLLLTWAFAPS